MSLILMSYGNMKIRMTEMIEKRGITKANLSILIKGKQGQYGFQQLEAICKALDYQSWDILEYRSDTER
ncbi:helix-turn-helix domain-containing protein [Rossellomorea sp. NS-SX7]|uniref:helix-turn-helix domain-containing protein n=1 Tax=Rossellomorea sp. NS-SX7 TaxID=3463856 RepID=UPI004059DA4E